MEKSTVRRFTRGEVSMVAMKVGSEFAAYDMRVSQIDRRDASVMPYLEGGKVMVPLQAVAEGLNGSFAEADGKVTAVIDGKKAVWESDFIPLESFVETYGMSIKFFNEEHFENVFVISRQDLAAYEKPQNIMAVECLMTRVDDLCEYISMEVPKAAFDLGNPLPVIDLPTLDRLSILTPDYIMKNIELYAPPADAEPKEGVPAGTLTHRRLEDCRMYPGVPHDVWTYVPAQYDGKTPAKLLIMTDGPAFIANTPRSVSVPNILDNMIHDGRLPVTVALFIAAGPVGPGNPTYGYFPGVWSDNRSSEYDSVDERFANFLVDEVMPVALEGINLSPVNTDRAIFGCSSGAPAALGAAWHRNEAIGSVFSACGSFANIRGAHLWPYALRREKKDIRVFYLSTERDAHLVFGNWYNIGREMANSLEYSGYDYVYAVGKAGHTSMWARTIFPDVFQWLFTGKAFQYDNIEVLSGKIDESTIEKR